MQRAVTRGIYKSSNANRWTPFEKVLQLFNAILSNQSKDVPCLLIVDKLLLLFLRFNINANTATYATG